MKHKISIFILCLFMLVPGILLCGCGDKTPNEPTEPISYNITYNLDGGTMEHQNPSSYSELSDFNLLKNPTKANNEFIGWFLDSDFSININDVTTNPQKDIQLYAKWKWYDISTPSDLQNVKLNCNYRLMNPLDMSGVTNFKPIGNFDNPYTGIFDGQGYTIENLTIMNANEGYAGIFGFTKDAEIKNFNIDSLSLFCTDVKFAGAVIGRASNCKIESIAVRSINVNVSNSSILSEHIYVGGLFGETEYDTVVYKCGLVGIDKNTVTVTKSSFGHAYVGGFIGNNQATLRVCFAFVDVKADGTNQRSNSIDIGGFCGYNCGNIEQVYFIGSYKSENCTDVNRAGLIAKNTGILRNFFSDNVSIYWKVVEIQNGVVDNGYIYTTSSDKIDYATNFADWSLTENESYMRTTMKFTDSNWKIREGYYPSITF